MAATRTLRDIANDLYKDEELVLHVIKDVAEKGTEALILAGDAVLPHPDDALRWLNKKLGRETQTATERAQAEVIKRQDERLIALEQQVKALTDAQSEGN